jgi:UDP-glucose 4-epimerase
MKILVTGGAGFIASNLTRRLLAAGHQVVAIDNFFLGKRKHLTPFLGNPNYRFIEQDLLDLPTLHQVFADEKPERVWHFAANSDISFGTKYTDFDLKGGTLVTYNVLEAMRLGGCRELLFSSSGAVYGEPTVHPTPEDYGPMLPISLYAASKLACEGLVSAYANSFDIQVWMFRFGNIIGPNSTHGVIPDFLGRLMDDPSHLKILGDGTQAKPYVHVEDCLDGMAFAQAHSGAILNYYNLAVPDRTTVTQIALWCMEALGIAPETCPMEYTGGPRGWRGDVPFVNLDIAKIGRLGWGPQMNSDGAVRRAIQEIADQLRAERANGDK